MALWGNIDDKGSGGTVSLDYSTLVVTGTATTFGQVGAAATGDVIRFGDPTGTYYGDSVIVGIASTTQLSIASTSNLSGDAISSVEFSISELPKYTTLDSHYKEGVSATYDALVYGVSGVEAGSADGTAYDVAHAGWVGVTTYLDWEGNLRVKSEVLVAMSSIEGDANDDARFPDPIITITSQPASVGVGTTETATFSVTATVSPTYAPLSYQWFEEGSAISGATGTSVSIANTDISKDGYEYQVTITSGDTTETSGIATMTVS